MFFRILQICFPELAAESWLRIFGYTTVRAGCALAFAFIVSLVIGPACIRRLRSLRVGQQVREFKTEETRQFNIHGHKHGTPTMGGILIIIAATVSVLGFCDPANSYVWLTLFVLLGAGAVGFQDDYLKVVRKDHRGVSARGKLVVQVALGCGVGAFLLFSPSHTTYVLEPGPPRSIVTGDDHLVVPFFKSLYPALGFLFIAWVALVLTASSNAVNLTDGLDGLAIGTVITTLLPFLAITYLVSRVDYSGYLYVPHVPQVGELAVFICALLGASLGFLWFNAHPAEVFMGDTGSLSLGAVIGTIAVLCKHEVLLMLLGGIFVAEALSVVIQVGSYKLRGTRVLLMSPLHNHYVRKGMDESKIIARFFIVGVLLALAGLSTLKLR